MYASIKPSLPSALIAFTPVLFAANAAVQQQPFPLAPDAICLSHSIDSSALSYMVRSPLSHPSAWSQIVRGPSCQLALICLKSFSTCTNLKCMCTFVSICSIQVQLWPHICTYITNRHTHASCNVVPLVWSLLRLAPIILSILKEVEINRGKRQGQRANTYNHAHFRLLH